MARLAEAAFAPDSGEAVDRIPDIHMGERQRRESESDDIGGAEVRNDQAFAECLSQGLAIGVAIGEMATAPVMFPRRDQSQARFRAARR